MNEDEVKSDDKFMKSVKKRFRDTERGKSMAGNSMFR